MGFLIIDQGKCLKCGACAKVCPRGIIAFREGSLPEGVGNAEKMCIQCGHCVAVCPVGALSLNGMLSSECDGIDESLNLTFDQAAQLIRSRRSTRQFKKEKVDKAIIEKIINVAKYAPTGLNRQNVKWKVVYDANKVVGLKNLVIEWMRNLARENDPMAVNYNFAAIADMCIKGHDMILRDAPHVIIAYSLKADPTAASSCMIALSNLELALHAHGIGACCAGFLDIAITGYPKLQEALELPAGHSSFGAMMAGYPKFKYKRIPGRKEADISWM